MEKLILVHYINVGNMDEQSVQKFIEDIALAVTPKDDDMICYCIPIPIRNGETRVECINPKLVSEDDFLEAKRVLDRNQEIVNDIINKTNVSVPNPPEPTIKTNDSVPKPPEPPIGRVIREGSIHFCDNCKSTMSKNGFLGLFGELLCHNSKCPNSISKK